MKIGIIGLVEAGNLGDDLVFLSLLMHLSDSLPGCSVKTLSFGELVDLESTIGELSLNLTVERVSPRRELPFGTGCEREFSDCDVLLVGGGGLVQDVHSYLRPYHWLRWIPREPKGPVYAIGLGIGPLTSRSVEVIRRSGVVFNRVFVRDSYSQSLGSSLGWPCTLSEDLVNSKFLGEISSQYGISGAGESRKLGVALRSWPGLSEADVAQHVVDVVETDSLTGVEFFVLEAKGGRGVDVDFTLRVAELLPFDASIWVYGESDIGTLVSRMSICSVAISMKLHSSALWSHFGAEIYPIIYSPKVASFFDLPYKGLEMRRVSIPPRAEVKGSELSVWSALQLVGAEIGGVAQSSGLRTTLRWACQILESVDSVSRLVGRLLKVRSGGRAA